MTDEQQPRRPKHPRGNYIGVPECFLLDHACAFINRAFGETCYLVGSATERTDFRDVDVRMIMGDAKFEALFGSGSNAQLSAFWSLINTSISLYLSKVTGLPVDFQIQQMTSANERWGRKSGQGTRREALGLHIESEGPEWATLELLDVPKSKRAEAEQ